MAQKNAQCNQWVCSDFQIWLHIAQFQQSTMRLDYACIVPVVIQSPNSLDYALRSLAIQSPDLLAEIETFMVNHIGMLEVSSQVHFGLQLIDFSP